LLNKGEHSPRGILRYLTQTDSTYFRTFDLGRDKDRSLIFSVLTASSATSYGSLIQLNDPAKFIAVGTNHRTPQFLEACPSRLIASQPEHPLQAEGAQPGLLIGHPPDNSKPRSQGQAATVKYRVRSYGDVAATGLATIMAASHFPGAGIGTQGACENSGPAQFKQVVAAGILGSEPMLKFEERFRESFAHKDILHVRGTQ
jgi:hypothetical protein